MMEKFGIILIGFILGLFSKLMYDFHLNRKEANCIRKSLLLEIIYMHDSSMYLQLSRYEIEYKSKKIKNENLHNLFIQASYTTNIYDNVSERIDRLFGSDISLQVHYYYSLIKSINNQSKFEDAPASSEDVLNYLKQLAYVYAMSVGVIDVLEGKSKSEVATNIQSILDEYSNKNKISAVKKVLKSYDLKGVADSIDNR